MNLVNGKILNNAEAEALIKELPRLVMEARSEEPPSAETVISACARVRVEAEEILPLLIKSGMTPERAEREFDKARKMMSEGYLKERLEREIGAYEAEFTPRGYPVSVRHGLAPLGTLFHIAAGNVDALPAFSVIEGLLSGNVNILKLPSDEGGLSVTLLSRLIEVEPLLKNRIFVFDFSSSDTAEMQMMAAVSDAVVVWGGDEAVRAVRKLAHPDTAIIEWGHKLSFCYASGPIEDGELDGVCRNILETEQLYCSSCQGIFLDTENEAELFAFAERFADMLEKAAQKLPSAFGAEVRAQNTLEMRTRELEGRVDGERMLRRKGCAVIVKNNSALEGSYMFRTPWVKALPRERILKTLLPQKGRLQTASLICPREDRQELSKLLIGSGVVRVCSGERMSDIYCAMPHDGCMPLLRYMKVVSEDMG